MSEKQHILVIDDDPQLVETVTTLLESVGYRTSFAHQLEKGLELAKTGKPDLILLDVLFDFQASFQIPDWRGRDRFTLLEQE